MQQLGRTGIEVSAYCLGTMVFGRTGNPDHDDCARMIHRALDGALKSVDTADVYSSSETEEIAGKALKGRRDDVVLATKFNGPMGEGPNRRGSSRRWAIAAVEDSLQRLQTDYIDLYQIHHPDPRPDIEGTLSALTDLVRAGKVRAIGSSNLNRAIEREVLPTCRRYGMGVLIWSPLSMGLLTGRYRKGSPQQNNARMHWVPKHLTDERKLDAVEQLLPVAEQAGRSLTHLAMAFATTHPDVTSAIIGPRTMDQLEDLLAGATTPLDDDVLDRIDAIVPPGIDISLLDVSYTPPSLVLTALRRRPVDERAAA